MTTNKRFKNVEENLEWGTVQYFTYHDEKITDKEIEKLVNHLLNQNEELKKENLDLSEELDYYKTKCASLETGLFQADRENEQLKKELKRCKDWINSDKNDYELTLAFIKSKGYSLKDVLEYERSCKEND